MPKRFLSLLAISLVLVAADAAQAQFGGGGMGGGMGGGGMGGRHGGGRRSQPSPDTPPPSDAPAQPRGPQTATDKVDIVGVIRAIDPATDRVTISYQEVDALNWPAGTTPFVVAKPSLLQGVTVGETVRFRIESQQVSALEPYKPAAGGQGASD